MWQSTVPRCLRQAISGLGRSSGTELAVLRVAQAPPPKRSLKSPAMVTGPVVGAAKTIHLPCLAGLVKDIPHVSLEDLIRRIICVSEE